MVRKYKYRVFWQKSTLAVGRFLTLIPFFTLIIGCSALNKDSNCLNEKSSCFKVDKTRPKVDSFQTQPLRDAANSVSALEYIDVTFSEEVKNGEIASTFAFKPNSNVHNFSVSSVQKISTYTYRLFVGGGLKATGQIELDISGITDYNDNLMDTITPVLFNGSVNIGIVGSVNHNGVSNAGGYASVDIQFHHIYTADVANANSYSIRLTSGAADCSIGSVLATGNNLAPNTNVNLNVPVASFASGMNRLVVCVNNLNNPNATNSASWPIIRDDVAPVLTYTPAADNYATPRTITLSCGNNLDKIAYTSASQQTTVPADPTAPTFDASGNVATGTQYSGFIVAANPANPTYTKFLWRCIDIAGNLSAAPTVVQFYIDSTIPDVVINLDSNYRQYISAINSTTTLTFSTDQVSKTYNIRRNGTTCAGGGDGTLLATGTTAATAGQTTSVVLDTTTHFTADNTNYPVRICVAGTGIQWGTAYLDITRDGTAPTIAATVVSGTYGALQSVEFTCSDGFGVVDKTAYSFTEAAGATVPGAPADPDFNTATGAITTGQQQTGPLSPTDRSTSRYAFRCIDRAGNRSTVAYSQYTIDATLPTVNFVSQDRTAVSSLASAYNDVTLTWSASRDQLTYRIRRVADCDHTGTPANTIASGTIAAINTNQSATIATASFPTSGVTYPVRICVYNFAGNSVYQTTAVNVTRDDGQPTVPIQAPTISQVDATNFTVSWNASTDNIGIAGYRIFRRLGAATYGTTADYTAVTTSVTIAMPDTQQYYLKIVPFDAAGNVPAAGAAYTEITTKPAITLVVTGLASPKTFDLTDGTASTTISANTAGTTWVTTLGTGATYNFRVTAQPSGQVCAMKELQFGTLNGNKTLNINCATGYMVSQNLNSVPATKMGFKLYQGKNAVVAGTKDTQGFTNITFRFPEYLAHLNGALYVADSNNYAVRKINLSDNSVTTLAGTGVQGAGDTSDDGTCGTAKFGQVMGITTDGTNLYVADFTYGRIRKISDVNGTCQVVTLAGTGASGFNDGAANVAQFNNPRQIAANNDYVFVADNLNHRIRCIALASGVVDTLAGDGTGLIDQNGTGASAKISNPHGMVLVGSNLFVTTGQQHIVSINVDTRVTTIVAGDGTAGYADGSGLKARFNNSFAMSSDGVDLYLADATNHLVRRVEISAGYRVTTIAGVYAAPDDVTGVGAAARFNVPHGIAFDGRSLYVANHTAHTVRKISDNGLVGFWPLAGNAFDYASDVATPQNGTVYGAPVTNATDRFGNAAAYAFDGAADFISALGTNLPTANQPRSVCAWVSVPDTSNSGNDGIVTYGRRGPNSVLGLRLGSPLALVAWDANGDIGFQRDVEVSRWTHTCVTHDGTISRTYFNGHLMAQASKTFSTSLGNICIGQRSNTSGTAACDGGSTFLKGSIADVRIYNRTLNQAEINELAQDAIGTAQVGNSFNAGAVGLLSHYQFNPGGAAPSLTDAGPLGYTLTATNSPAYTTGVDGDAGAVYVFDGSSQYLSSASAGGVPQGTTPRTICAWVNPAVYLGSQVIAAYGADSNNNAFGLKLYNNNQVAITAWNNDAIANISIPLNTWTHLCGTFDGSTPIIYRDGIAATTGSFTGAISTTSGGLVIGRNPGASGAGYFQGKIDDVRIYNTVLSAFQVRQLATQVPTGLVARYDFSGDRSDVSGFGQDLSNNGASLGSDRFGGANTAATLSSSAYFETTMVGIPVANTPRTVCAWGRPSALSASFSRLAMYGTVSNSFGIGLDSGRYFTINGTSDLISIQTPPLNIWRHLCATYDGTTEILYLDGSALTSHASFGTLATGSSGVLRIGRAIDTTDYFTGALDDVRVYNRALTASEVLALVTQPNKKLVLSVTANNGLHDGGGGITGADAICTSVGANYKAFIVDGSTRVACTTANCGGGVAENTGWVMRPNITYVRADGITPVQVAGTGGIWSIPLLNSVAAGASTNYWTGFNNDWTQAANCNASGNAWNTSAALTNGIFARSDALDSASIYIFSPPANGCSNSYNLLCVEQ
jgi:hypothetical protein